MNGALGNAGQTVTYVDPIAAEPVDHLESLASLVVDMNTDQVDLLSSSVAIPFIRRPRIFRLPTRCAGWRFASTSVSMTTRRQRSVIGTSRSALPRELE